MEIKIKLVTDKIRTFMLNKKEKEVVKLLQIMVWIIKFLEQTILDCNSLLHRIATIISIMKNLQLSTLNQPTARVLLLLVQDQWDPLKNQLLRKIMRNRINLWKKFLQILLVKHLTQRKMKQKIILNQLKNFYLVLMILQIF